MELETTSTFMKEVMTMLRRNVKIKMALKNEPSPQPARPAIALGPPPPPPIPNLDSPKGSFGKTKIQLKSNQFKSSSSTPSTSFSLKGNGDWPMVIYYTLILRNSTLLNLFLTLVPLYF